MASDPDPNTAFMSLTHTSPPLILRTVRRSCIDPDKQSTLEILALTRESTMYRVTFSESSFTTERWLTNILSIAQIRNPQVLWIDWVFDALCGSEQINHSYTVATVIKAHHRSLHLEILTQYGGGPQVAYCLSYALQYPLLFY